MERSKNREGETAAFDAVALTSNNVVSLDKVRLGRFPLDSFSYGLFGKLVGVDGARIDKEIGALQFTGAVDNIVNQAMPGLVSAQASGTANTLSAAQLTWKVDKALDLRTGYFWGDIPGTSTSTGQGTLLTNIGSFQSSQGLELGLRKKRGNHTLLGEYVSTTLDGVVKLPYNPKGVCADD